MQVAHNTLVVVADGRKALFLRNEGDAAHPNLVVEHAEDRINPADRDQKTDAPGRASGAVGGRADTVDEVDFHQQEEDRFAADIGAVLRSGALANEFESLIIVAPARTLGELRKHYHVEVERRMAGEIAKDLTGHPVPEIEKALGAA
ncbi:MAG: host attachment protein [Proteobacteria bacterium]|nr:host attachment protein [Pseudomonadota bacterium]